MSKGSSGGVSLGTIGGFVFGWILIIWSMFSTSGGKIGIYIDAPSFVMVVCGSTLAMFICFEAKDVIQAHKGFLSIFKKYKDTVRSYKDEVGQFVQWGYIMQKNGVQGLEGEVLESVGNDDPFLRYGLELLISNYTAAEIRDFLKEDAFSTYQRQGRSPEVMKQLGANAPAFGMAGTLVGLVAMLSNMGGDASSIGSGMSVALITTFYGVLAARLFYLPAFVKLGQRADDTLFRNLMITEALVLLAERRNPRYIQDRLNSMLDPSQHFLIDRDMQR